jgi:class 3 adenylate cyclase
MPLTGAMIAFQGRGFLTKHPVLSFIVFILLIGFVILLSYKLSYKFKQKYLLSSYVIRRDYQPITAKPKFHSVELKTEQAQAKQEVKDETEKQTRTIETDSLVLHHAEGNTTILFANLKDFSSKQKDFTDNMLNELKEFYSKSIVSIIEHSGGIAHKIKDSLILGLFRPTLKYPNSEIIAVRVAVRIKKMLEDYNSKLKNKIDFGIGVHTSKHAILGERIRKYTDIGKTTILARKFAELAHNEIVISNITYQEVSEYVKAEKFRSIKLEDKDKVIESYHVKAIV